MVLMNYSDRKNAMNCYQGYQKYNEATNCRKNILVDASSHNYIE